ncbi:MAG: hypothetical protein MJB57_06150 [Gemmatimonadetes bacterium]|nr:hypothetical protein [Gemmatimonadota bacterium]
MGWSDEANADPKVISIRPWLTPTLVPEASPREATVIPIPTEAMTRRERRRRVPKTYLLVGGLCWVVVALL